MDIVEMIKTTADNHHELMMAIADHILHLEQRIKELEHKLASPVAPTPSTRKGMKKISDPR